MFTSFEYLNSDSIVVSLSIDRSRMDNYNALVLICLTVLTHTFYSDMDYLSQLNIRRYYVCLNAAVTDVAREFDNFE
jgi:hypothetical protein